MRNTGFSIIDTNPPDGELEQCAICGRDPYTCVCPECPKCGEQGRPKCYEDHDMEYTEAQIEAIEKWEAYIMAEIENEKNYYRSIEEDLEVN